VKWVVIAIAVAVSLYAAYAITYPTYSYRFRITIDVDTDEGVKSGSSVLEVTTIQYPSWITLGANDHQTTVRGEAVFVDLGDGRNLVALLALGPHAEDGRAKLFAPRSFFQITEGSPRDTEWTKTLSAMKGRRTYASDKRPTLVTFGNLGDPASVREVPFENPQAVLGPGVRAVRAAIDLTRDPITAGLSSKIPWVDSFASAQIAWNIVRQG